MDVFRPYGKAISYIYKPYFFYNIEFKITEKRVKIYCSGVNDNKS